MPVMTYPEWYRAESNPNLLGAWDGGQMAERDRCAKICEEAAEAAYRSFVNDGAVEEEAVYRALHRAAKKIRRSG